VAILAWGRLAGLLFALLALNACGHNLYLVGRTSGATGSARIVTTPGHPGGDVTILLAGKTYTGRWVYMSNGGSVSLDTATVTSSGQTATATGAGVSAPMQGNGSIIASAPDGSSLRCVFNYSEWNSSGLGVCRDSKGEIYDLQIN